MNKMAIPSDELPTEQPGLMHRQKILLPVILFIVTLITSTVAGAMQRFCNPFTGTLRLIGGLPFSLTFLTILLAHELGHFFASRRHGVQSTLPYFIPAPPLFVTGTFGAVIKARSPVMNRNALMDIAASGPIAGFIISMAATVIGLNMSYKFPMPIPVEFGSSIIFHILSYLVLGPINEHQYILMHPIAIAGWIGFMVTSVNLLPIGQSDGGHISYALFGKRHLSISISIIILLIILGIFVWPLWILPAIMFSILGIRHPSLKYEQMPLDRKRSFTGWLNLIIFVLTFMPVPIR